MGSRKHRLGARYSADKVSSMSSAGAARPRSPRSPPVPARQNLSAATAGVERVHHGEGATEQFNVDVTDRRGRTSQDVYVGVPGARPLHRDVKGRAWRLRLP